MSGFVSESTGPDEKGLATKRYAEMEPVQGQRHERLETGTSDSSIKPHGDDISAGQKMLSAVSGSLFTSLLGKGKRFLRTEEEQGR